MPGSLQSNLLNSKREWVIELPSFINEQPSTKSNKFLDLWSLVIYLSHQFYCRLVWSWKNWSSCSCWSSRSCISRAILKTLDCDCLFGSSAPRTSIWVLPFCAYVHIVETSLLEIQWLMSRYFDIDLWEGHKKLGSEEVVVGFHLSLTMTIRFQKLAKKIRRL